VGTVLSNVNIVAPAVRETEDIWENLEHRSLAGFFTRHNLVIVTSEIVN
jgi:hypothetical protein